MSIYLWLILEFIYYSYNLLLWTSTLILKLKQQFYKKPYLKKYIQTFRITKKLYRICFFTPHFVTSHAQEDGKRSNSNKIILQQSNQKATPSCFTSFDWHRLLNSFIQSNATKRRGVNVDFLILAPAEII